jgi:hypothetical protein
MCGQEPQVVAVAVSTTISDGSWVLGSGTESQLGW